MGIVSCGVLEVVVQRIYYNRQRVVMIFNKLSTKDKKSNSSKKVHRRVITEIDQQPPPPIFKHQLKKHQKINSKPKFIDVYSKYIPKDNNSQKKHFKIYPNKPNTDKHLKTEPDEPSKLNISANHQQKPKLSAAKYQIQGVAGKGTFGVVYYGTNRTTGEKIAIKKVFQDKKYKNREHQILKMLKHPNNLIMKESFLTHEGEDEYLNIVMDYFPDNLYQAIKKKEISPFLIKIYTYQMVRGLNYLAMIAIAHRDIKPQNILVDNLKHKLIISDFGSAKQLVKTEANLAYICSRCYRAPELIFGATDYTPQIDMWSAGCVLVEMVNGSPPFMGDSQIDQLIEIIKVLGTPSKMEVEEMNRLYDMKEFNKFPKIKTTPWKNLLQTRDPLLIDLVTKILQYSPVKRLTPAEALYHQYFEQLRDEAKSQEMMLKIKTIPDLFDYSQEQLAYIYQVTKRKGELVPSWVAKKNNLMQITANKLTTASTNTKRSLLSYKPI